jgi:hypothetical protein
MIVSAIKRLLAVVDFGKTNDALGAARSLAEIYRKAGKAKPPLLITWN